MLKLTDINGSVCWHVEFKSTWLKIVKRGHFMRANNQVSLQVIKRSFSHSMHSYFRRVSKRTMYAHLLFPQERKRKFITMTVVSTRILSQRSGKLKMASSSASRQTIFYSFPSRIEKLSNTTIIIKYICWILNCYLFAYRENKHVFFVISSCKHSSES